MGVLEWVAVVVAVVALVIVLALGGLFLRRRILQRQGGFDMCLRVGRTAWGGGWVFGIGCIEATTWNGSGPSVTAGDRSGRRLALTSTSLTGERQIRRKRTTFRRSCRIRLCDVRGSLEVSMSEGASMAFLAWLEAAPPEGTWSRRRQRQLTELGRCHDKMPRWTDSG